MIEQQFSSKNTSVNSARLPAVFNFAVSKGLIKPEFNILDIGGGKFDNVKEHLYAKYKAKNYIYDKYNRGKDHNSDVLNFFSRKKADMAVISNVLNVIMEDDIKREIIKLAIDKTKDNGLILIKVYEGNKTSIGHVSKKDCWQENKLSHEYLKFIPKHHQERAKVKGGVIIISK